MTDMKTTSPAGCLEVEYGITVEDLADLQRYSNSQLSIQKGQNRSNAMSWVTVFVFAGIVLWSVLSDAFQVNGHSSFKTGLLAGFLSALILLMVLFLVRIRYLNSAEAAARTAFELDPGRYGHVSMMISPNELRTSTPTSQTTTQWHGIMKIEEGQHCAFFFTSLTQVHFVPRRAFQDDECYRNFVETARRYHDQALAAEGRFGERAKARSAGDYRESGGDAEQGITR